MSRLDDPSLSSKETLEVVNDSHVIYKKTEFELVSSTTNASFCAKTSCYRRQDKKRMLMSVS